MAEVDLKLNLDLKEAVKGIRSFGKKAGKSLVSVGKSLAKLARSGFNKFSNAAKKSFNSLRKSIFSVQSAIAGVAAFLAGRALLNAINRVTDAASIQEDAINQLNTALRISGQFSQEASEDFQAYASSLQQATKFGDEVILQNAALIQSLGQLDTDGLKKATAAALDLSAALGIDLTSASNLIGKAAAGNIETFSRYGVIIQKGADTSETFANAIEAINKQFGGAAAAQVNTFSGAADQLSNTFGDLQEELGFIITKNPAVIALFKTLNGILQDLIGTTKENSDEISSFLSDAIDSIVRSVPRAIRSLATFIRGTTNVRAAAFALKDTFKIVFRGIADSVNLVAKVFEADFEFIALSIAKTVRDWDRLLGVFGKRTAAEIKASEAVYKTALEGYENSTDRASEALLQLQENIENSQPDIEGFRSFNEEMEKLAEAADAAADAADIAVNKFEKLSKTAPGSFQGGDVDIQVTTTFFGDVAAKFVESVEELNKVVPQLTGILVKLGSAVVQGGKEGAEAFVKTIATEGSAAALDAFSAGAGQAAKPFIEATFGVLVKGADEVRKRVREFAAALPLVIDAVAEAAPALVEEIANKSDEIAIALARAMPKVATALAAASPDIAMSLALAVRDAIAEVFADPSLLANILLPTGSPQVIGAIIAQAFSSGEFITGVKTAIASVGTAFDQRISQSIGRFGQNLGAVLERILLNFPIIKQLDAVINRLEELNPPWLQRLSKLVEDLKNINIGSIGGRGSTSPGQRVVQTVENITGVRLNSGGTVPQGFPDDTFPAALSSGEMVVPRDDTRRLSDFLDRNDSGEGQTRLLAQIAALLASPMQVQTSVEVSGQSLADIILELERNNSRLAV